MARTFKLRRFANPGILRRIDYKMLVPFIQHFQDYFERRDVSITENANDFDYRQLASVLMTPDSDMPRQLIEAISLIDELSDPEYFDRLVKLAHAKSDDQELGMWTPEDLALWLWLEDAELLARLHAETYRKGFMRRARKFESFFAKEGQPLAWREATTTIAEQIEDDLNRWAEKRGIGRYFKLFVFAPEEEDGPVWMLLRHGRPMRREATIEANGESGSQVFRPEHYDIMVYYPQFGELAINAKYKSEKQAYCEAIGRRIYAEADLFAFDGTASKYSLSPLIEDHYDSLFCGDVEGMESVRLTELHLHSKVNHGDIEIHKSGDVFHMLQRNKRCLQRLGFSTQLAKAKFRVLFSDGRERSVMLEPPNGAMLDFESDHEVVQDWFIKRGFVQLSSSHIDRPVVCNA